MCKFRSCTFTSLSIQTVTYAIKSLVVIVDYCTMNRIDFRSIENKFAATCLQWWRRIQQFSDFEMFGKKIWKKNNKIILLFEWLIQRGFLQIISFLKTWLFVFCAKNCVEFFIQVINLSREILVNLNCSQKIRFRSDRKTLFAAQNAP